MLPLVIVAAIAVLFFEVVVFVWVVGIVATATGSFAWLGTIAVIGALCLASAGGVVMLRRGGLGAFRRERELVRRRCVPSRSDTEAMLHEVAAILLAIPGFVTGVGGLLLLVPPIRAGTTTLVSWTLKTSFEWNTRVAAKQMAAGRAEMPMKAPSMMPLPNRVGVDTADTGGAWSEAGYSEGASELDSAIVAGSSLDPSVRVSAEAGFFGQDEASPQDQALWESFGAQALGDTSGEKGRRSRSTKFTKRTTSKKGRHE